MADGEGRRAGAATSCCCTAPRTPIPGAGFPRHASAQPGVTVFPVEWLVDANAVENRELVEAVTFEPRLLPEGRRTTGPLVDPSSTTARARPTGSCTATCIGPGLPLGSAHPEGAAGCGRSGRRWLASIIWVKRGLRLSPASALPLAGGVTLYALTGVVGILSLIGMRTPVAGTVLGGSCLRWERVPTPGRVFELGPFRGSRCCFWHCSDPARGRSTPTCLDGSASSFRTERASRYPSSEEVSVPIPGSHQAVEVNPPRRHARKGVHRTPE